MKSRKSLLRISNALQTRKTHVGSVTNDILFKDTGMSYFNKTLPFGKNNSYPNDVLFAIENSPTAKGCTSLRSDYIYGLGVENGDKIIVNRQNESLNDVIKKSIEKYSPLNGFALHFNYNVFGQISEIQNVQIEYLRLHKDLDKIYFGKYPNPAPGKEILFYLYDPKNFRDQVKADGGIKNYSGQIYYYKSVGELYPTAMIHASFQSAKFEDSLQTYNFANIENSFNSSGLIKIPYMTDGDEAVKDVEGKIAKLKGSKNAGGMIVISAPLDMEGKTNNVNFYESFALNNVDKLYVEQTANAKENILEEFMIPDILLGRSKEGMFNQASFDDASRYYNGKTESERQIIENAFMKFWSNTVFASQLPEIKITPLIKEGINNTNDQQKNANN